MIFDFASMQSTHDIALMMVVCFVLLNVCFSAFGDLVRLVCGVVLVGAWELLLVQAGRHSACRTML
jgi:hypothetical protein